MILNALHSAPQYLAYFTESCFDHFYSWSKWIFISAVIIATLLLGVRYGKHRILAKIFNTVNFLFFGTFVSSIILFYPIYYHALQPTANDPEIWRALLTALQHTFRLFALDGEYLGFKELLTELVEASVLTEAQMESWIRLSTWLYVCAPLLTFTFLLSFFKNLVSHIRYSTAFFRTTHIFSELNDKTLALAKSIAKKEDDSYKGWNWFKKLFVGSSIVFTDIIDENKEKYYEFIDEANSLGAILFRKDLDSIKLIRFRKTRKIKIYLISEDENEKIRHATSVMNQYDYPNVELYVFSEKVQSRLILGVKDIKRMKVVRVNDIQNLIYHNLDTYGKRLFDNAKARYSGEGNIKISAVIVGFGRYGSELLRALSWFCQYPGFDLEVDVFDNDKDVKSKFEALYPSMIEVSERTAPERGDANYKLNFYEEININSVAFKEKFDEIKNPTYIFVSLGTDSDNIEAALNIRTICAQRGITPDIETVVYDSNSAKLMSCVWTPDAEPEFIRCGKNPNAGKDDKSTKSDGVKNYKGQAYNIHMIGDLESFYSCDTVINARWEKEGEIINRRYSGVDESSTEEQKYIADRGFWQYEYNYKSSVSKAIHERLKYKLNDTEYRADLPFMSTPLASWADDNKIEYSKLEHIRWNAYMRSEGYSSGKERYDLAKRHNLILTNADLAKKDEAEHTTKRLDDAI